MNTILQPTSRNRGTVYVLVLMISMLVTVIGLTALASVRVQLRSAMLSGDVDDARLCAQSSLELAKQWIYADANWRTNRSSSAWATDVKIGAGSFNITAVDPVDGIISNSPLDPIVITVTGFKGTARQQLTCKLAPAPTPYSCLQSGVTTGGHLYVNGGRTTCSATISSNGNITATGQIDANVEAVGTCTGSGFIGSKTTGATAKKMPTAATVFDYYIANGTPISYASLSGDMHDVLLSPSSNPYGATNALGIYVVDCGDKKIKIDHLRVVGTLVLLNPKSDSDIKGPVNMAPAFPGHPALMIKAANISIQFDNNTLNEGAGKNYNPPGTPYNGVTNSTTTDVYPGAINGLIYVSGNAWMSKDTVVNGAIVVGGALAIDDNPVITWDASLLSNPPAGFFDSPPMKVVSTTWAQSVN